MKPSDLLGEVEHLILLAVLRLDGGAYAVTIGEEIRSRAGVTLSRGTVYVTLGRLARKGYLESWFAEPTPERGGKAKRLFKLLPEGLRALDRTGRAFRGMSEGLVMRGGS